jgi:intracellular multiplication protein IcmV
MGIISGTKRLLNPVGRLRKWTGVDSSVTFGSSVVEMAKGLFSVRKGQSTQSFDAKTQSMGLDEVTLQQRARDFLRMATFGLIATVAIWSYMIYLLLGQAWHGAIVSLGVSFVVLALSFRYHFWYFQIKQRRLGCTLSDWWRIGILGRSEHE